jgi:hypothetical protein
MRRCANTPEAPDSLICNAPDVILKFFKKEHASPHLSDSIALILASDRVKVRLA